MAKWTKRNNPHTARTTIVRVPQARPVAPIIRVSAPRAAPKKKHHHRKHHGGAITGNVLMNAALAGAVIGFAEKSFGAQLPAIPFIGRKGAIALGAYFMNKGRGSGLLRDVAFAGAVLSGYELGATGKISGIDGDIAPQVSGIASQV
jgi:hypothetical protein